MIGLFLNIFSLKCISYIIQKQFENKKGVTHYMSYADQIFIQNCKDILSRGVWDKDLPVRPRWNDGTPAHTIKLFGVVNRYDLRKEFPVMTLRRTAFKGCIDELLWIWQTGF